MSLVDISGVSLSLFLTGVVFILLVFGLLSFGILRMFQLRFKAGWFSFAGAVLSGVAFAIVLNTWFV
ncbi:hypothetical protein ACFOQM_23900 [Paenibacillus sp. GCM10012307]|uniref:Uncharacterized protein n=1 Tax=Paenibacillus roseus TaxID=2798579 RepID=A0A934MST5_9BACL|nr:hypothetical protein [Paenibacillus roseus]